MSDTNVPVRALSSLSQDGSLTQPSVQDVAPHSTQIDLQFLEESDSEKTLVVALCLIKGLLDNTYNGDVVSLAQLQAAHLLEGYMDREQTLDLCQKIIHGIRRRKNSLDKMFDQKGFDRP